MCWNIFLLLKKISFKINIFFKYRRGIFDIFWEFSRGKYFVCLGKLDGFYKSGYI